MKLSNNLNNISTGIVNTISINSSNCTSSVNTINLNANATTVISGGILCDNITSASSATLNTNVNGGYYTTFDMNKYYDDMIKNYLKENPEKLQHLITELRKEKLQQLKNDINE